MNILTLKIGEKFSSDYANAQYNALKKHSSVDFNYYCYTDNTCGLHKNIISVEIPNVKLFEQQFHKFQFHKTGFASIPVGEKCLVLDIDYIPIQNIDDILQWPVKKGEFGCIERWWSQRLDQCAINGGFQMYHMGDTNHLWERFSTSPTFWTNYYKSNGLCLSAGPCGEQHFIDQHVQLKRNWLPKQWFVRYNRDLIEETQILWEERIDECPHYWQERFHRNIKMVMHWTDNEDDMIHNSDEPWIKEYYDNRLD